ncbi:MAG TPA: patatin-like phospholipase family protein [Saprospiraceae bacterium]|nr:patatin-like phospholipase family protein [Saprospiraceae bacterium]
MKKQIALVLSGGGARGLAHIGIIEELEARGYHIHAIAGTSMGALVGGSYAAGKLPELKQWFLDLDMLELLQLVDFTFSPHGFIKADKVFNILKGIIPDTEISALRIPYTATAYDLALDEEVVYRKGSLFDAIRASVAIPSVLTPVKSGDSVVVDGGVVNNLPLSNIKRKKNDLLVAVHVNARVPVLELPEDPAPKIDLPALQKVDAYLNKLFKVKDKKENKELSYFEFIEMNFDAMRDRMVLMALQQHPADVLIEVSRHTCGTFDFHKTKSLVETGRLAARQKLDALNL